MPAATLELASHWWSRPSPRAGSAPGSSTRIWAERRWTPIGRCWLSEPGAANLTARSATRPRRLEPSAWGTISSPDRVPASADGWPVASLTPYVVPGDLQVLGWTRDPPAWGTGGGDSKVLGRGNSPWSSGNCAPTSLTPGGVQTDLAP